MKVLIVSATTFEIEPLLSKMGASHYCTTNPIHGIYKNIEIDFLVTGIGMVATSYYTAKVLNKTYNLALNIGICGSFNNNLEIGNVVNVYEDCFSELGAEDGEEFVPLEELKLDGITKVSNINQVFFNSVIELLPKVTGITVNTTHGNEKRIDNVFQKFHPYVESMEGAAFMFVCEQEQIPYLQIRAVSNIVERRNKNNWNIPLAIVNLNKKIVEVLDSL
jgi:futalosine hydrolase